MGFYKPLHHAYTSTILEQEIIQQLLQAVSKTGLLIFMMHGALVP